MDAASQRRRALLELTELSNFSVYRLSTADRCKRRAMELSPTVKINFLFNQEKYHGTKVLEESIGQSWARDAKAQVRDFEERPIRQEGQEPETGDRDRTLRSSPRGKESPSEKKFKEKLEQTKEQQKEIRTQVETLVPELCFSSTASLPGHPHLSHY